MAAPKKITVIRLASVHYQHFDLAKAAAFLEDFGLQEVAREQERIYFAGFGIDPYVYVAEQAPTTRRAFIGGTWVVESEKDLLIAAEHPNATAIQPDKGPGGGKRVDIVDPNGYLVSFIHGQALREGSGSGEKSRDMKDSKPVFNLVEEKPRKGEFRRSITVLARFTSLATTDTSSRKSPIKILSSGTPL